MRTYSNQTSKGTRKAITSIDDGNPLTLLLSFPYRTNDEYYRRHQTSFESSKQHSNSNSLRVVLNEACSKCDDRPGNHSDTQNTIGTESFDCHGPRHLEQNVERVEQSRNCIELVSDKTDTCDIRLAETDVCIPCDVSLPSSKPKTFAFPRFDLSR